jgi:two-component system sensor histidine kinase VanS
MMLKYDALFHKKNLKIASEIEKDCRILGNREYIEQAAGNYIMNAFAHCGEGRHMKISLAKKDGKAVFGVYNDSEPLTDEEKRKIWEKYYQGEEQTGHSGLGLHIVKTVITMHGGTYGVDNRENGVCFWFSLPLV